MKGGSEILSLSKERNSGSMEINTRVGKGNYT